MNSYTAILSTIVAHLLGSISFKRLVARLVDPKLDIENVHLTKADGSTG